MESLIKDRIRTSILVYEPRINVLALELDSSAGQDGQIGMLLEYEIRATNSRFNLVYPFLTPREQEAPRASEQD